MTATRHDTPCSEFHELDKRVERLHVVVDSHTIRLGLHSDRIAKAEEEFNKMQLSQAKQTALYSAIGSALSIVAVMVVKWLLTRG